MGKKKKRNKYTSKGKHSSFNRALVGAVRKARSAYERYENKIRAWAKGQNPWVTIANPSVNETNKKFIRVRADELWGKPNRGFAIKGSSSD